MFISSLSSLPLVSHLFTRCLPSMAFLPSSLPHSCPSLLLNDFSFLLCGILSQKPVSQPAGDLTRPFCRSAIRIGSCREKTASEGTSGSRRLAALIPNQRFIYNSTLVFAPPRHSAQIWERRRGARGAVTCDGAQISRPSGGISPKC